MVKIGLFWAFWRVVEVVVDIVVFVLLIEHP